LRFVATAGWARKGSALCAVGAGERVDLAAGLAPGLVDGSGAGGAFATVLVCAVLLCVVLLCVVLLCVVELCVDAGTGGFAGFAGGLALIVEGAIVAGEIVAGAIVAGAVLVLLPLAGVALLGVGTLDFAVLVTAFPLGLRA
jgi:hypothetical protein